MEIACIVEGDGEEAALPVLLRRIIFEVDPTLYARIPRPIVQPRGLLVKQEHLALWIEIASQQLTGVGAVLVLLDADDDCPADLGPRLLTWATEARRDVRFSVVVAKCEYEAWFIAAAESLRGHRGLSTDLVAPADPESIRGAKEWLTRHMPRGRPYDPTVHQASFSQVMSLEQARRAPSFEKLCRDVRRLVEALRSPDG